jgi:hypothetical protein
MMVETIAVKGFEEGNSTYELSVRFQYSVGLIHHYERKPDVLQHRYRQDELEAIILEG